MGLKRKEYAEQILSRLKKYDSLSEDEKSGLRDEICDKCEMLSRYIDATAMRPLVQKWVNMETFDDDKCSIAKHLLSSGYCYWTDSMDNVISNSFGDDAPLSESRYEAAKLFWQSSDHEYQSSNEDTLLNYLMRYDANREWKPVEKESDDLKIDDIDGKICYFKSQYMAKEYNRSNGVALRQLYLLEDEVVWLSDEGLVRIPLNAIVATELVKDGYYHLLHLFIQNKAGIYLSGYIEELVELKEAITYFKKRGKRQNVISENPVRQHPDVELERPAPSKTDRPAKRDADPFEADLRSALYPLYERLQQIDAEQEYSTFCVQWGKLYRKGGVMFVGRAVNGWITDDRDTANLFGRGNESQIFARSDQMQWVEQKNECARSAFWRVVSGVSRNITDNGNGWYDGIAYSNLYKLAPSNGGNPSNALCGRQYDLCAEILVKEIEILAPSVAVMLNGVDWYYDFLCSLNGDADPECIDRRTWSGGKIEIYRIGNTLYMGGDHPQGKDEKAYIEALTTVIYGNGAKNGVE